MGDVVSKLEMSSRGSELLDSLGVQGCWIWDSGFNGLGVRGLGVRVSGLGATSRYVMESNEATTAATSSVSSSTGPDRLTASSSHAAGAMLPALI